MNFMRLLELFGIFFFGDLLELAQGTILRTWKAAIHLGGLRHPLALYLGLLVAHPKVPCGYAPSPTFVGLGSLFMIFS